MGSSTGVRHERQEVSSTGSRVQLLLELVFFFAEFICSNTILADLPEWSTLGKPRGNQKSLKWNIVPRMLKCYFLGRRRDTLTEVHRPGWSPRSLIMVVYEKNISRTFDRKCWLNLETIFLKITVLLSGCRKFRCTLQIAKIRPQFTGWLVTEPPRTEWFGFVKESEACRSLRRLSRQIKPIIEGKYEAGLGD